MQKKKGLTLVELLVVIVILAALAAVALPRITQSSTNAKKRACQTNLSSMNSQIEMYYSNNDAWPTFAQITDANNFPDGAPTCPSSGTYSINSTTNRANCSKAASLGHKL